MDDTPPVLPAATSYVDRSGWLTFFGIVQILLGVLCGLMVALVLFASVFPTKEETSVTSLFLAAVMYSAAAIGFIWLGIGSMKACRWARSLSQLIAWGWLAGGIFGLAGAALILPQAIESATHQTATTPETVAAAKFGAGIALVFIMGFMAIFCIVLPGIMAWFFGSKNVKATCDTNYPQPSWTDACPPLVLFVCLWLAFGAIMSVLTSLLGHHAFPFFGILLTGWPAGLTTLGLGALSGLCAWLLYRLQPAGWWLALACMTLTAISGILSSLQIDNETLLRAMGRSDASIQALQKMGPDFDALRLGAIFVGAVPMLVLMLLIRKYFRATPRAQTIL